MRASFIASLLLLGACIGNGAPKSPSEGGAPWVELTSPHFILRTDLAAEDARATIDELEKIDDVLQHVGFPPTTKVPNRILVIDFATQSELAAYAPLNSDGVMFATLPNDLESQSTLLISGPIDETHAKQRIIFTHELTHQMIHESFGGAPPWMNEGLAQYFSSLVVEDDGVTLGDLPWERLPLQPSAIPTAETIARADRHSFYGGMNYTGTSADRYLQTAAFYVGSWWLVHMLRNGPSEVTSRFDKVIAAADNGESLAKAWDEIMVPDGYAWLDDQFRSYLGIDHLDLATVKYVPSALKVRPVERELSDLEVHLLWARLTNWKNEEGGRGLAQLEIATKEDPSSPEVLYWRGVARLRRNDFEGAITLFRACLVGEPDSPRYLLGLGEAQLEKVRVDRSQENLAALTTTVTSLERVAVSASQLTLVAQLYDSQSRRDRAASFADRAMAADPSCVGCVAMRARIAFEDGWLDDAVRLQRRAISLLPDGANDQPLQKSLHEYEAVVTAQPASPAAPKTN